MRSETPSRERRRGYEPFWKVKPVAVALVDNDTEFRCKDCYGGVKLLGRNGKTGRCPMSSTIIG